MESYKEILAFCHLSNNFKWKGNAEELKSFVFLLLDENDEAVNEGIAEIIEDSVHNAVSLKLPDLSLRLYYSTETLKLFGSKSSFIREKLYAVLGTFERSCLNQTPKGDGLQQRTAIASCEVTDELNFIKGELAAIKSLISPSTQDQELVKENIEQGRKICKLENDNKFLNEVNCNYKLQIQKLEEEKQSLLTAMTLVIKETTPKSRSQGNANANQQNDKKNKKKTKRSENSPLYADNNQNESTSTSSNTSVTNPPNESHPPNESQAGSASKPNRRNAVIVGDSVISRIEGWRLNNETTRVSVKSFSGAKVEDMSHYIKPTLNHAPDEMIIHIGTNNLRKDTPEEICKKVENLCCMVEKECPNTKIALSEITPRRDFKEASQKRELTNKGLLSLCQSKNLTFITHPAINEGSLNSRGVHLNRNGTSLIAKDFKHFIQN